MTVNAAPRSAGPFTGDGTNTSFPFGFKTLASDDLIVVVGGSLGETVLVKDTDYTVALNPDQGVTPGGTVTYPISGPAMDSQHRLSVISGMPYEQATTLPNGGPFNPVTIEKALDNLAMQTQQVVEQVSRAVKVGISSPSTPDQLMTDISTSVTNAAGSASAAAGSASAAAGSASAAAGSASAAADSAARISLPLPITSGGTGASSVPGALTNFGIINVTTEVSINAVTTIPNSFPASYLIEDSAVPADYVVNLPAAAAVGSVVFFRVSRTATKMFTLYDSGTLIDGIDRRILWAGETVMLLKTSSGWTKISGNSIPLRGALLRTSDQTLAAGAWPPIVFTSASQDSTGLNLCFDSGNGCFVARRDGTYKFTASFSINGVTAGSESNGAFSLGNIGASAGSPTAMSIGLAVAGLSRVTHNISNTYALTRGGLYGVVARGAAGTPAVEYVAGVLEITMSYEEVLTW